MTGLGESLKKEYEGKTIIIDGFEGKVYIEPDYTTISKRNRDKMRTYAGTESGTSEGKRKYYAERTKN